MFISHKYKLLFLEVPRTASRSISQALAELDPQSPTMERRKGGKVGADYHRFRDELLNDPEYRVIATHRNPYERLWSFWKHRRKTGNPAIFKSTSWTAYVDWVCEPSTMPELKGAMRDIPIADMFDLDRVDFWLDFADLENSWKRLAAELELPLPALKSLNASPDHGNLCNAYSEALADRVGKRFAADFRFFGYDVDSWKAGKELAENSVDATAEAIVVDRPRVAVLTTFAGHMSAYSLQRVVQDQLAMFVKHGYEPTLLVVASRYWDDEPEGYFGDEQVRIFQYPSVKWINQEDEDEIFLADVETLTASLAEGLQDIDVVITHDIIYIPMFLKLSIACRHLSRQRPDLKWLHWVHSATGPEQLKKQGIAEILYSDVMAQEWPGSHPVYFNRMSIPRIARNFSYGESDVKIVPHATNVGAFLGLGSLANRLYEEKRLYLADYVTIVPVRLDRGKQVDWVIRILAALKALGDSVRIVVMDFHSQAEDKGRYRDDLKTIAANWGLNDEELTFMSEFEPSVRVEAPHGLVRELFSVANLFIQPSRSESYSLTTQEAALCGNLLVLNDDFPPFREMFGEQALYFQFSANIDRLQLQDGDTRLCIEPLVLPYPPAGYPENLVSKVDGAWRITGEAAHAHVIANRVRYEFLNNRVLRQRQKRLRDRNLFTVFERYLEPLIQTVCGS